MTHYHYAALAALAVYLYAGALIAHRVCRIVWRAYAKAPRAGTTRHDVDRECQRQATIIIAIWPLWLVWLGARMALVALVESAERAARRGDP